MLKAMRKHAKFFYVLFFIVILSFIFWGVGTVDKSTGVPVAEVGKERVTVEEYWTSYERAREFYRTLSQGSFTEEMEKNLNLKQRVLDSLIDDLVLLAEAKKAGILVSNTEVADAIVNDPAFVRDGSFSREIYVRTLQLNRMTPELFESLKRRELILARMHRLIGESVDVLANDVPQASGDEQARALQRQTALIQMRDRAVKSYIEGLKQQMKIKVNQQLIS
ncbi:MAG TPA: SurA N-terminal domain-containing protein [Thermodesulfovibrionales bacterium]|nr:SurA N-terminal domain-containing protein [Thermodesulfovibrionales bacterium]